MVKGYVIRAFNSRAYLQSYDPDYHPDPDSPFSGDSVWTEELEDAMVFELPEQAWNLWRAQSVTVPQRPDGKPNRPLTAFSVEVMPL